MIWLSFEVLKETAGFFDQQTVADILPLNLKCSETSNASTTTHWT